VYAPEAITPFAKEFSEFFSSFVGSEYLPDDASKKRIPDVLHQDLLNLTFEDSSLDVVITNDVLEHVPSIDTCLSEIYRVLAPGGWHLGTHPFAMGGKNSIVRATITNGEIQFSGEAEYHGNPVDPEGGSLVFEVPGWDILDRAKKAGFSIAEMRFIVNENAGVLSNIGGIFVLCLQK
jgi:SAM-dependent methyltransferase